MAIIEMNKLTKYYGKARGIIDLDLKVDEGDFFGFIGPNGAGKSTAIRTLLGLISPTSGSASVLGMPLKESNKYLADIGYLQSETWFYSGMKVSEIIDYSAKLRKMDCKAEAERLCERLNLDVKKRVEELSLGNRKKVGIVCALQHKPQLYIMDEPTSGLDPLMQREFFELLHERQSEGATIFFSSHVLSEIQHHCNRAAIIREGRLVAENSMEELAESSAKRVTLHGVNAVPEKLGAKSIETDSGSVSFLYNGPMGELLSTLSTMSIDDMTITDPDLEEIFMHYYEKGGEA